MKRILVVSSDAATGQALQATLARAGLAAEVRDLGDPAALADEGLAVVSFDATTRAIPTAGGPIIAVLPRSELAAIVDLLQATPRVVGISVGIDDELGAMVKRLADDDLFGLAKLVPAGTEIRTHAVRHYEDKRKAMAALAALVEATPGARKYRDAIEQSVDEMVMNALYAAPVDAEGKHVFAGVPARVRVMQRTQQVVQVAYACDGKQLAISVRDAYGTLERDVLLRYLYKCIHSTEKVDRKAGGAGLGLYLMTSTAAAVYFHRVPGVATEVTCVFDLETTKQTLQRFGYLEQRDPRGLVAAGPARKRAASPKRKILAAVAALSVIGVVVGAVLAWPVLFPPPVPTHAAVTVRTIPAGATIELEGRTVGMTSSGMLVVDQLEIGKSYPVLARLQGHAPEHGVVRVAQGGSELTLTLKPVATVELDSTPPGAIVEIAGKVVGTTPLTVATLTPGASVPVTFKRVGFRTAIASVRVPAAGKIEKHVQPLEVSDDHVKVRFTSQPPGAEVVQPGAPPSTDHTYTPAEVYVEAGKPQRFVIAMPGRVPVLVELSPERGKPIEKAVELVPGVVLRVESKAGGKASVEGAPHCQALAIPFECTLAPGTYTIVRDGAKREITVADATTLSLD